MSVRVAHACDELTVGRVSISGHYTTDIQLLLVF